MVDGKKLLTQQLQSSQALYGMFLADFSDEEFFTPPCEKGNHAAWIMGHIAVSEDGISAALSGRDPKFPEDVRKKFEGGSKCVADASAYPSRGEIMDMFETARAQLIKELEAYDESKWDDESPERFPTDFFPTKGSVWGLNGTHAFWHIGQLTVCRQALGKPSAFGQPAEAT